MRLRRTADRPPAGKIALIDRGACSISVKVDRAANAGAIGILIGLVAAGDAVSSPSAAATISCPSLVIQQSLSNSHQGAARGPRR